jgi:hypothetical protein
LVIVVKRSNDLQIAIRSNKSDGGCVELCAHVIYILLLFRVEMTGRACLWLCAL